MSAKLIITNSETARSYEFELTRDETLIGRAVDRIGNYDAVALVLAAWVVPGSLIWLRWRPPVRFIPRG